jgi:hypothetical protein
MGFAPGVRLVSPPVHILHPRAEEETVRAAFQPVKGATAAGTVDFESLRTLSDEGIDMSFMDNLQKLYSHRQVSWQQARDDSFFQCGVLAASW